MDNQHAIAILRRMQEPEAYEPQITAEAFEALGMAIRAIRMTEVLAGELDGCPLPAPCHKLFDTGWCKEHCKSQEATAACWLKYAEVVVDDHFAEVSKKATQPEQVRTQMSSADCISRQAAIDALGEEPEVWSGNDEYAQGLNNQWHYDVNALKAVPPAQPEPCEDAVSREAAIDIFDDYNVSVENGDLEAYSRDRKRLCALPSAQPERTCVNCGRTANNGGWYADGRTRCPIEEHYALPKDGYCHLWEKRNVTDDDYPERREENG